MSLDSLLSLIEPKAQVPTRYRTITDAMLTGLSGRSHSIPTFTHSITFPSTRCLI